MRTASWLTGIGMTTAAAFGQTHLQREVTFTQPAAFTTPRFGYALDLDGDTLAVSTGMIPNLATGWLQLYTRESGSWAALQTIGVWGLGGAGIDELPHTNTVSLDGDRVAVGMPLNDEAAVYRRVGGAYALEQQFQGTAGSHFGSSVAIQGNRLVLGASTDGTPGFAEGALHVYELGPSSWTLTQTLAPQVHGFGELGLAVALDGDRIAALVRGSGQLADGVRVYELAGGTWTGTALLSMQGDARDVALDGDTVVAGSVFGSGSGARIWRRDGGAWNLEQTLTGSASLYGFSVAVEGDELVVGSPSWSGSTVVGHVHRYHRDGAAWQPVDDIVAPTSSVDDEFGYCVAIDGVSVAASATRDDAAGLNRGAVSVYRVLGSLGDEVCSGAAPAPCPCGNSTNATFDEGCRNSTGDGAFLQIFGSASVLADDLEAVVNHVQPNASVLLFQGSTPTAGAGTAFHDGVLCAGGSIVRLQTVLANTRGIARIGPGLAANGAWIGGQSIVLQAWHRDALGPCGTGSNLSQGVRVVLAP